MNKLDLENAVNEILSFIRKEVRESGASGVVVGISGGIDSSVTAALCVHALGKEKVLGIIMPTSFTPEKDINDALELANNLGIETKTIPIDNVCNTLINILGFDPNDPRIRIPAANLRARIRMIILYFYANLKNYLVAGTSDKSEYLIGYFTKYGDGAADFFPIRHLFKTQVGEIASYLGIPDSIIRKPSSPQLYPGHKLTDELPINYPLLDFVIIKLFEEKLPAEKISEELGVPIEIVRDILSRHIKTEHKRRTPHTLNTLKN